MVWQGESKRHELARKGIKTKYDEYNKKSEWSNTKLELMIKDLYKECTIEEMNDIDNECAMGNVKVHKILYVSDGSMNREHFIFEGTVAGVKNTYYIWTQYFPGSYYDPPDFDFGWNTLKGEIKEIQRIIDTYKNSPRHSYIIEREKENINWLKQYLKE